MKLYLAGPMTGYPDLNFPHFAEVTEKLRSAGHVVINPAEVNPDKEAKWEDCMKADIAELITCDGIAMLEGWPKSRGATLERYIALQLGMPVHCAYALIAELNKPAK